CVHPVVQRLSEEFDLLAAFPHLFYDLQRLVDLLLLLVHVALVPFSDEGFKRFRRGFWLCPHGAEFETKTKASAAAHHSCNPDLVWSLKLHFHQITRPQVDSAVKFHARPAQLTHQSRHSHTFGARFGLDQNRQVHMKSGPAASVDRGHLVAVVIKPNLLAQSISASHLFQQTEVEQVRRSGKTYGEQANRTRQLKPPGPPVFALCRCGPQFFNPILLRFVLIGALPNERSQPALIGRGDRNETEWLQV